MSVCPGITISITTIAPVVCVNQQLEIRGRVGGVTRRRAGGAVCQGHTAGRLKPVSAGRRSGARIELVEYEVGSVKKAAWFSVRLSLADTQRVSSK